MIFLGGAKVIIPGLLFRSIGNSETFTEIVPLSMFLNFVTSISFEISGLLFEVMKTCFLVCAPILLTFVHMDFYIA